MTTYKVTRKVRTGRDSDSILTLVVVNGTRLTAGHLADEGKAAIEVANGLVERAHNRPGHLTQTLASVWPERLPASTARLMSS
jgi:hypothetical protein